MATNFSVKGDTSELERVQRDFVALAQKLGELTAIKALASAAQGMIVERTQRGDDINEAQFRPYSKMWADWRKSRGLPTGHVNLTVTGTMHEAIDFEVLGPLAADLYVKPATHPSDPTYSPRDQVAEAHQRSGREWFGLSPKQVDELEQQWIALTLRAMLDTIQDARPLGNEISQLQGVRKIDTKPRGPFSDYD